jgi:hypothetical protein
VANQNPHPKYRVTLEPKSSQLGFYPLTRVQEDPTGLGLFANPKYKCVLPVFFALFLKLLSQICFIFFVDFFIDVAGKKSLSRQ